MQRQDKAYSNKIVCGGRSFSKTGHLMLSNPSENGSGKADAARSHSSILND
jgi:hypothetical protein